MREGDPEGVLGRLKGMLEENMRAIDDPLLTDSY
jgi:hypothetical protein